MAKTRFVIRILTADGSVYTGGGSTVKAYKAGTTTFVSNAVKNTDDDGLYFFEDLATGLYDIKVSDLYQPELRNILVIGDSVLGWDFVRSNQYFVDPLAENKENHYTTIQAAIDAIATEGYINIAPGNYDESITIQNKSVYFSTLPNPLSPAARDGIAWIRGDSTDLTKPSIKIDHTDHGTSTKRFTVGFHGVGITRYKPNGVAGNQFADGVAVLNFKNQGNDGISGGGTPDWYDVVQFLNCDLRFQTWYTQQDEYAMRFYGSGYRVVIDGCHIGVGDHVTSGAADFDLMGYYKWFLTAEDTRATKQNSTHSLASIAMNNNFIQFGKLLNVRKPNTGTNSGDKAIELKGAGASRPVHLYCMSNSFDIMNDKLADVSNNGDAHTDLDVHNDWGIRQEGFNSAAC